MRWRWGVVAGLAVVAVVVSVVMWGHHRNDLAVLWTVIAGFVALMAAAVSWARAGMSRRRIVPALSAEALAETMRGLALAVQRQWQAESDLRRVQDPWPLPVRWVITTRRVGDYWAAVRGVAGGDTPLELAGELDEITDVFRRVPSGRLVVLGEGGAGKTVLLMRLMLGLLDVWAAGEPVPVLLSVASWDSRIPLDTWLVDRLGEEYPWLAAPAGSGATFARELVSAGLVLPLLDGLDEIPDAPRGDAIRAMNLVSSRVARLVVSCRGDEYEEAVRSGDVLSRAALSPLPVAELQSYLRVTTPPGRADVWDRMFAEMTADPGGPVAAAMSTPLMAWLARIGYGEANHNPDELLTVKTDGTRLFATRSQVEEQLLDRYIPAIYALTTTPSTNWTTPATQRWLTASQGEPLLGSCSA